MTFKYIVKPRDNQKGFTIVELLVVIVVIGILAAITIVSYTGISQRATVSSLQSDLTNASQQLKLYYQLYSSYPTTMVGNCPTAPTADNTYCIKSSSGNTLTYSSITPNTFHLTDTNTNNSSYSATDSTTPAIATTINGSSTGSACPTGFIPVPGSGTYSTNDFCVMKYEASQVGATNVPTSIPSVQPWVSISQTTAIANSQNVANCTGCHLITEAEWLTVAQNVLSVASNWDDGAGNHTTGVGYIYSGHNDSSPANSLAADPSDANSYAGTGNIAPSNQKRTLTLTNGQVIWDLAGNVYEWTSGVTNGTTAQQPGISGAGWGWREWTAITTNGGLLINTSPTGTGFTGANVWNSGQGMGQIYSNSDDTGLYGFICGGYWGRGAGGSGVLSLNLSYGPGITNSILGFRVSR